MARNRSDAAWAWACALLAAGVSIAVNVGHARPVSWGFVAFAATLPVMIVGAAELMVRRLLPAWIVGAIGVSAYALSFWHTILLLCSWGEPVPLAVAGSVAVDGLMVGATVALYRLRRTAPVRAAGPPAVAVDVVARPAAPETLGHPVDRELVRRGLPALTGPVLAEIAAETGAAISTIKNRAAKLRKEAA